ncbi:hypothetical protein NDU88_003009 [Pleurodeles waltl]|uniref:Uncharacterized protein n=1 Tax=Pleurodeles waltl TaxID=8319 RepID=A0AAV7WTE9_PLEWA|nr:hypothetical protein NDU88_003009 [Pleurodeles waltl]
MSLSCAVHGEDPDPILGLRPRRVLTMACGRRKGPPRAPRPLTRAASSPAVRPGDTVAPPAIRLGGAAAARCATIMNKIMFKKLWTGRELCPQDANPGAYSAIEFLCRDVYGLTKEL